MEALPTDVQARVWRTYFGAFVLPDLKAETSRRHYTNSVVPRIAEKGESMGRMWRAFISNDNVMVGVSRAMDDGMNEEEVRAYVASVAVKNVASVAVKNVAQKDAAGRAPVEIRELGSREIHVFDGRGEYGGMYVSP